MPLSVARPALVLLGIIASLATSCWSATGTETALAVDDDVTKLAQGLRTLTEMSVSNTRELEAALADASIDAIVVQGGFYNLTATLNVTRSVAITAADAGRAVLNGQGKVQVLHIATSGTVHLAGLNITGGHTDLVRRGEIQTFFEPVRCAADHNLKFACLLELSSIAPLEVVSRNLLWNAVAGAAPVLDDLPHLFLVRTFLTLKTNLRHVRYILRGVTSTAVQSVHCICNARYSMKCQMTWMHLDEY